MGESARELWLVRTSKNLISGPFPREHVREMVRGKQLGLKDELCRADHYWFYLEETEELAAQLGVEVPTELWAERFPKDPHDSDNEVTQTQIVSSGHAPKPHAPVHEVSAPEPRESRPHRPKARVLPAQIPLPEVFILGKFERPVLWRGLVWVLVAAMAVIIYSVLRLLEAPS